jgi:hypothetical protein
MEDWRFLYPRFARVHYLLRTLEYLSSDLLPRPRGEGYKVALASLLERFRSHLLDVPDRERMQDMRALMRRAARFEELLLAECEDHTGRRYEKLIAPPRPSNSLPLDVNRHSPKASTMHLDTRACGTVLFTSTT